MDVTGKWSILSDSDSGILSNGSSMASEHGHGFWQTIKLRTKYRCLQEELEPYDIMDPLIQFNILTNDDGETLKYVKTRKLRARKCIDMLLKKGNAISTYLIQALEMTNNTHLVKELKSPQKEVKVCECCTCGEKSIKELLDSLSGGLLSLDLDDICMALFEYELMTFPEMEYFLFLQTILQKIENFREVLNKNNTTQDAYCRMHGVILACIREKGPTDIVDSAVDIMTKRTCLYCSASRGVRQDLLLRDVCASSPNDTSENIREEEEGTHMVLKIELKNTIAHSARRRIIDELKKKPEIENVYEGCIILLVDLSKIPQSGRNGETISQQIVTEIRKMDTHGSNLTLTNYEIVKWVKSQESELMQMQMKLLQNAFLLFEELDIVHFTPLFEKDLTFRENLRNQNRRSRVRLLLNYILSENHHCIHPFMELLNSKRYQYVYDRVFKSDGDSTEAEELSHIPLRRKKTVHSERPTSLESGYGTYSKGTYREDIVGNQMTQTDAMWDTTLNEEHTRTPRQVYVEAVDMKEEHSTVESKTLHTPETSTTSVVQNAESNPNVMISSQRDHEERATDIENASRQSDKLFTQDNLNDNDDKTLHCHCFSGFFQKSIIPSTGSYNIAHASKFKDSADIVAVRNFRPLQRGYLEVDDGASTPTQNRGKSALLSKSTSPHLEVTKMETDADKTKKKRRKKKHKKEKRIHPNPNILAKQEEETKTSLKEGERQGNTD